METITNNKGTQALQLSDNEFTTENPVTKVTLSTINTHSYSTPWIFLIVLLSMLTIFALYCIFILIVQPLTRKSNTCRYFLPCYRSCTDFLIPATDIFLDVVHVSSREQIRVFLTTMAAPACSLSFTGSVKISNFWLTKKNLHTTLYIDWHNCLLHYNEHVITLPAKGKAFSFQQNLLTSFSRPGLYNIQLLARHMDTLLQIPHALELDFVTSSDLLSDIQSIIHVLINKFMMKFLVWCHYPIPHRHLILLWLIPLSSENILCKNLCNIALPWCVSVSWAEKLIFSKTFKFLPSLSGGCHVW